MFLRKPGSTGVRTRVGIVPQEYTGRTLTFSGGTSSTLGTSVAQARERNFCRDPRCNSYIPYAIARSDTSYLINSRANKTTNILQGESTFAWFLHKIHPNFRLVLQVGYKPLVIIGSSNTLPLSPSILEIPNYHHPHLLPWVCTFEPFGKWTKVLLYILPGATVRPCGVPVVLPNQIQGDICESR